MSVVKCIPIISASFLIFQLVRAETPKNSSVDIQFALSARDLPDTDELDLGSPDPYVEVSYFDTIGSKNPSFVNRTKTLDNNHNPNWDEVFHVKYYEGRGQRLKFKVMDADTLVKDDEIGIVELRLKEIAESKFSSLVKPIVGSRKQNGKLVINIKLDNKVTAETDTRLFKKPSEQMNMDKKQQHYIILVAAAY